jgi:hypothetical protein
VSTINTTPAAVTAPVPAPHIAERLAYVRFLHQEGVRQAVRPHPMSSAAILSFHDAVELFFVAAFDHLHAPVGLQAPFPSYWPELAKLVPTLTGQRVVERLNRIRRDLKHHGVIPPHGQVNTLRADVATFLAANTKTVFGFDYETISMADLILQAGVRVKVQAAQASEVAGDRREAMGLLAEAFEDLLQPEYDGGTRLPEQLNFAPRSPSLHLHSPNFGETERVLCALRNERSHVDVRRVASQIDATTEFAVAAQSALRGTQLRLRRGPCLRRAQRRAQRPGYHRHLHPRRHRRDRRRARHPHR